MSLQEFLSKYQEQRDLLDRMDAERDALITKRNISIKIIEAARESLEEAQAAYFEALGTTSEPGAAEAVRHARENLQQVNDCHAGLETKIEQEFPRALADVRERERETEERRLEFLRGRVLGEVMKEELQAISPDTIRHLYRAHVSRGSHIEWGVWLSIVFPLPNEQEVRQALNGVLTTYGIE